MPSKDPDKQREYHKRWRSRNREKINAYHRELYARNLEYYRAKNRESRKKNYVPHPRKGLTPEERRQRDIDIRRERKRQLVEMMGGKCVRCGYNEHPAALDFHHTDSTTKEIDISRRMLYRFEEIVVEVTTKCQLLCANCHRIHTHDPEFFKETGEPQPSNVK